MEIDAVGLRHLAFTRTDCSIAPDDDHHHSAHLPVNFSAKTTRRPPTEKKWSAIPSAQLSASGSNCFRIQSSARPGSEQEGVPLESIYPYPSHNTVRALCFARSQSCLPVYGRPSRLSGPDRVNQQCGDRGRGSIERLFLGCSELHTQDGPNLLLLSTRR